MLAKRIRGPEAGSRVAFESFYRREYHRIYQLAWLLTRSDELAEDLTQEAFFGTYRAFDRLQTPEAYVRTAVVNQARMAVRRRFGREKRAALLQSPATTDLAVSELTDIITGLPYRQRVVVVGRYWFGWSEREIAEMLQCRPGTVKSLSSRGLQRIRKELGEP